MTSPSSDLTKTATAAIYAVCELQRYRKELPDAVDEAAVSFLRAVTDVISPYKVEELDARIADLNKRYPDCEHYYVRCGLTVTWGDRPRQPATGTQPPSKPQHAGNGQPTTQPAPSRAGRLRP
jgi:hypothetical protein